MTVVEASGLPSSQPGVLLIHLLNRCNLRCKHCYLGAGPWQRDYLPLDLAIRSIHEVEALGVSRVFLSGGEPFLYQGLPEVLESVAQLTGVELRVSTNGTLIGSREATLLKESGATVQVSVDGIDTYHDEFRGQQGAFRMTLHGIQELVAAEVPVAMVTTVCRDNLTSLSWLAGWAASMGISRISVQPLLGMGRGSDLRERRLSGEELSDLFLQLSDLARSFLDEGLRFSLSYRSRKFLLLHPCAAYVCNGLGCHRRVDKEIKKLVIREDGTVLPEIPTLDQRFALGNLRDGTLAKLLEEYFGDGYQQFKNLCKAVYQEVIPNWDSPIVPWNEILSERSRTADYDALSSGDVESKASTLPPKTSGLKSLDPATPGTPPVPFLIEN